LRPRLGGGSRAQRALGPHAARERERPMSAFDPKSPDPKIPDPKGPAEKGAEARPITTAPSSAEQRLDAEGMRMLLEVSRRINAERDPESLLAAVVDSLVTVTKADRGFLMLKEGAGLRFAMARD